MEINVIIKKNEDDTLLTAVPEYNIVVGMSEKIKADHKAILLFFKSLNARKKTLKTVIVPKKLEVNNATPLDTPNTLNIMLNKKDQPIGCLKKYCENSS